MFPNYFSKKTFSKSMPQHTIQLELFDAEDGVGSPAMRLSFMDHSTGCSFVNPEIGFVFADVDGVEHIDGMIEVLTRAKVFLEDDKVASED